MKTDDKKLRKKRNRQRFNRSCFAETAIELAPFEKEKNVSDCSFSRGSVGGDDEGGGGGGGGTPDSDHSKSLMQVSITRGPSRKMMC